MRESNIVSVSFNAHFLKHLRQYEGSNRLKLFCVIFTTTISVITHYDDDLYYEENTRSWSSLDTKFFLTTIGIRCKISQCLQFRVVVLRIFCSVGNLGDLFAFTLSTFFRQKNEIYMYIYVLENRCSSIVAGDVVFLNGNFHASFKKLTYLVHLILLSFLAGHLLFII